MKSSPTSKRASSTGFSVRWGRLTVFGIGALALLTALVTAVASIFGASIWLTALIAALIAAGCYATLRGLVVLDAKKRAWEREELRIAVGLGTDQMGYQAETADQPNPAHHNEVFDFSDTPPAVAPDEQANTVAPQETKQPAPIPAGVPVPRPMYLDAPEVERPESTPMVAPKHPAPSADVQLSDGVSSEYREKITEKANTRLDLDTVLNRRRAI